jgi:non-canonical purine NTP pyrophosphatase (RdgB/HAM1 family)
MNEPPVFVTGNQGKADYLAKLLDIPLRHQKVELDELQSLDLHTIIEHKIRQAHEVIQAPVLVEDVSLEFVALGKMPGPFIKWFLTSAGEEVCCRMLDSFSDRRAIIRCTFGYYDGEQITFFDSEMTGSISEEPRGENGFGFDRIVINDGYDITRAEMTTEDNERTYRELMKPIPKVKAFLHSLML